MPLQTHLVVEPFKKWELDFVGTINPPSMQKSHILVCTYYGTKWVEFRSLVKATKQAVSDFLYTDIFVRFGFPQEIVIDGGSQFTSKLITSLTKKSDFSIPLSSYWEGGRHKQNIGVYTHKNSVDSSKRLGQ